MVRSPYISMTGLLTALPMSALFLLPVAPAPPGLHGRQHLLLHQRHIEAELGRGCLPEVQHRGAGGGGEQRDKAASGFMGR